MLRQVAIIVAAQASGLKTLDYLCRRFSYCTRSQWRREILAGRIRINGASASPQQALQTGDRLSYKPRQFAEPPVDIHYELLHEDEALLVVNKPGNLPCHPGGRYFHHTLWAQLKTERGMDYAACVHRIDRETSGTVLIAKTPIAARALRHAFESGCVNRRYLALVEGLFPAARQDLEGYLTADTTSPVRKKRRFWPKDVQGPLPAPAQTCRTVFDRIACYQDITLVAAELCSGRTHQIRSSLHYLGFPVVGDKLYGLDDTFFLRFIAGTLCAQDRRLLRLQRQALHAVQIDLPHPLSKRRLCFSAPLPADMASLARAKQPWTAGRLRHAGRGCGRMQGTACQ